VLGALAADVLGSPWDKLLIVAVLTSAAACTQTAILPATRTALSMATKGAIPKYFARTHPTYFTPTTATVWMGAICVAWYVGLTHFTPNILADSVAGLGLAIAFYYGLTALMCPWYYRRHLWRTPRNTLLLLVAPVLGGLALVWAMAFSLVTLPDGPRRIFFGLMGLGTLLMLVQFAVHREFFKLRAELAPDPIP